MDEQEMGKTKQVGMQTVFRDGEAQTDPYTPNFVIPEGTNPEILLLENLSSSQGLPLGEKEIRMIEHARKKRHVEENMPPFTDEANLNLRKRLLEKQELKEYAIREGEIDQSHIQRLDQVKRALALRDEGAVFLAEQKVETLRQDRMEKREEALEKIRKKRLKVLRKLVKQRSQANPVLSTTQKRDVMGEYRSFESEVYAPLKRGGTQLSSSLTNQRTASLGRSNNQPFDEEGNQGGRMSTTLEDIDTINKFESKLPPSSSINPVSTIRALERAKRQTGAQIREKDEIAGDIERMHTLLLTKKTMGQGGGVSGGVGGVGGGGTQGSLAKESLALSAKEMLVKTYGGNRMMERPPTPILEERGGGEGQSTRMMMEDGKLTSSQLHARKQRILEQQSISKAALFLQALIKGRASQNAMFSSRFTFGPLIQELRRAYETKEVEKQNLDEVLKRAQVQRISRSTVDMVGGVVSSHLSSYLNEEKKKQDQSTTDNSQQEEEEDEDEN